jgi:hypothetical protein
VIRSIPRVKEDQDERPYAETEHVTTETSYRWLTEVIVDEESGELWPQFTSPCTTPEAATRHGRTLAGPRTGEHWELVEVVTETVTRVKWRAV